MSLEQRNVVSEPVRKGQRSFYHPNSVAAVTALPACATSVWGGQVSAWQPVSGLVSLQEERRSWAKPPDLQLAFPADRPALPCTSFVSRWGQVRELLGRGAELHPSNPWEVGEVTPADSNCQLARQRRRKPGTKDREWGERSGRRAEEERKRMTRG